MKPTDLVHMLSGHRKSEASMQVHVFPHAIEQLCFNLHIMYDICTYIIIHWTYKKQIYVNKYKVVISCELCSNIAILVRHSIIKLLSYVKSFCVITKPSSRSTSTIDAKCKAIITGRDGPRVSCGNKALKGQIFKVSYLQFVDR